MAKGVALVAGNAHSKLAQRTAHHLQLPLTKIFLLKQQNGEVTVTVCESVRDCHVFVLDTGAGLRHADGNGLSSVEDKRGQFRESVWSVNDTVVSLALLTAACKKNGAARVTLVLSSFPYARQDKRENSRSTIAARLVADLLSEAGADHIVTVELHSPQIQGFFRIPVDNLSADHILLEYIRATFMKSSQLEKTIDSSLVVVAPDAGGAKRASGIAQSLQLPLAIIHKEREALRDGGAVKEMVLVGKVTDKIVLLVDDMADTCGTLCLAAQRLLAQGAKEVHALVVHAVLSNGKESLKMLKAAGISRLVCTNSIVPIDRDRGADDLECVVLDISMMLADAIRASHRGGKDALMESLHNRTSSSPKPFSIL